VQDVIDAAKGGCFFNGHQIAGLFHHANKTFVAASVAADYAGICLGKGKTTTAQPNTTMELSKTLRQGQCFGSGSAQEVQGKTGSGLTADTGQTGQVMNQPFKSRGYNLHGN
jgi:hypothetical protein